MFVVIWFTCVILAESVFAKDLCDDIVFNTEIGFNPLKGDCTKYVQCQTEENVTKSITRSCSFGQFWDPDALTCRPSNLTKCVDDPCRQSESGFTYRMREFGCRAYWKCVDGFSVGQCCARKHRYIEGMGCVPKMTCLEPCPPSKQITSKFTSSTVCDKKAHWDKRYYIEIVYGRGEVVRPCPAGKIFYKQKCACDFDV